jgi:FkbM family methyltransferase
MRSPLGFVLSHPLCRNRPLAAAGRVFGWQIRSRLRREILVDWIADARLIVRRGMTGATGNIYCGLHEFPEMGFLLHLLRPGDLFFDVGANVGSYTVLASKVCGARSVAFEPDPDTAAHLRRNIAINAIGDLVTVEQAAVGAEAGQVAFTVGHDTTNRVATNADHEVQQVPIKRLDDAAGAPILVKLDVEGFEAQALAGASRLLSSPSLLAVQSELADPQVQARLRADGFEPVFYDPFTRELSDGPVGHRVSNTIFVRGRDRVAARLRSAPRRDVLGWSL